MDYPPTHSPLMILVESSEEAKRLIAGAVRQELELAYQRILSSGAPWQLSLARSAAMPKKALSYREAAQYTGLSKSTLARAEKAAALRAQRVGGRVLFEVDELDRFLRGDAPFPGGPPSRVINPGFAPKNGDATRG